MNENNTNQIQQPQIKEDDKCYILILAGGMGARIIQTGFIRSLLKKRRLENNEWPIYVFDNSLIGFMVSGALNDQNVYGVQISESPHGFPVDPGIISIENGKPEHPMFDEKWRKNLQQYDLAGGGSFRNLLHNNLDRCFQIEYGFSLTKSIHQHKLKNSKSSFIGHLYSKSMGLSWEDDYYPILKQTETNENLKNYLDKSDKPYILMHVGMDRNSQDFMSPINYRLHKVWSLERYREVVASLSHKFNFIQVYANQHNPELEGVTSIKVENLHQVLQILKHPLCYSFLSIDNYLPHLASSFQKTGIVLWGSVSPYVWGWNHNINIWNKHSCSDIACWRPGMFDVSPAGKSFVCDHYSCMRSIKTNQVLNAFDELEDKIRITKSKTHSKQISL